MSVFFRDCMGERSHLFVLKAHILFFKNYKEKLDITNIGGLCVFLFYLSYIFFYK